MELLHKAALYAVLTFVIIGAAISLAGPDRVSAPASDNAKTTSQAAAGTVELASTAGEDSETGNSGT